MRIALPLAALLAITVPAAAQDVAPVDGKPGTDIVSAGTIGDVHVVAETTLAKGRLVLHVVAVNRGKANAPFGPENIALAAADGTAIALLPRDRLLAEAGAPGPVAGSTASSGYAAPTLSTNGAGQLDTTGYTGGMGAVSASGVPQDTLDRSRAAPPKVDVGKLDEVLLKQVEVKPGAVEGGQVVSDKLKLRGDRIVVVTVNFAGERHIVRLPAPKN
ncbi:hypothetical protein [Sphingomonas pruni]|uniref:hypothetical protein n=1 Tax=Sphingomonas pruni TaxID=40683 RepID=UPI00083570ED|nr:hypothetical protein [Sphingomonas pruni]